MEPKQLLVVIEDELFRSLTVSALESVFPGRVEAARGVEDAIRRVDESAPEAVVSYYPLRDGNVELLSEHLMRKIPSVPLLIISDRDPAEVKKAFPRATGIFEKKVAFSAIRTFFQPKAAKAVSPNKAYIPIKLSVLVEMMMLATDVYLKLGEKNYVRYLQKDDAFGPDDGKKLIEKRVTQLYIKAEDAEGFFGGFQDLLEASAKTLAANPEEMMILGADFLDTTQKLAENFGWNEDVVKAATKAIAVAAKAVSANPGIQKLLEARITSGGSKAKELVTLTSLLACSISQKLEWSSDLTRMKLSMAALLHDITLDEYTCEHMGEWNLRAEKKEDKSSEIEAYRNHPVAAAAKIRNIPDLPPDVDQIVLQHHERPDGTGFPLGLQAGRISPLSAILIFCEDLALYIIDAPDRKAAVKEFAATHGEKYAAGVFRKIYQAFAEDVAGG